MAVKKHDVPRGEGARKIYDYINEFSMSSDSNVRNLEISHLANTISGEKPVCLISEWTIQDIPKKIFEDVLRINKNIKMEFVQLPFGGGQGTGICIGSQDNINIIKSIFSFGKEAHSDDAFSVEMNMYHLLLGRALGYSDEEISLFTKKNVQTILKEFQESKSKAES